MSNIQWPSTEQSKKRRRMDDEDEDDIASDSTLRCIGSHVYFNGPVDDRSVGDLVLLIQQRNYEFQMIASHELVADATPAPMFLHLNTDGGTLMSAMWAVDAIESSQVPIYTIINGRTSSAGTLIAVVGHRRFMTRNSYLLIHQLRSGVVGKYNDIQDEYENCQRLMEDIVRIYRSRTKLSEEQIREYLHRDLYWRFDVCLEHGFVDAEWTGRPTQELPPELVELLNGMARPPASSGPDGRDPPVGGRPPSPTPDHPSNRPPPIIIPTSPHRVGESPPPPPRPVE